MASDCEGAGTHEGRVQRLCDRYSEVVSAPPECHQAHRELPSVAQRRRLAESYARIISREDRWRQPGAILGASLIEAFIVRDLDTSESTHLLGSPRTLDVESEDLRKGNWPSLTVERPSLAEDRLPRDDCSNPGRRSRAHYEIELARIEEPLGH